MSSEEIGTLPHALQAKLDRPGGRPRLRIETDSVVAHANPERILVVLKLHSSYLRGRMTDHVAHRS